MLSIYYPIMTYLFIQQIFSEHFLFYQAMYWCSGVHRVNKRPSSCSHKTYRPPVYTRKPLRHDDPSPGQAQSFTKMSNAVKTSLITEHFGPGCKEGGVQKKGKAGQAESRSVEHSFFDYVGLDLDIQGQWRLPPVGRYHMRKIQRWNETKGNSSCLNFG